jgi:hypothetical protein
LQLFQPGVGYFQSYACSPCSCFIVHADDPAINGETEIGLYAVSSKLPGQTKGFQRVFRGFP